jgi:hypothetical protein
MVRACTLEITPAGSKKWRFRYLFEGKDKRITLGNYPVVGLKEAGLSSLERRKFDSSVVSHKTAAESSSLTCRLY